MIDKYEINQLSPVQHQLKIKVPFEEFDLHNSKAIDWLRQNVKIDGFRKGKASVQAVKAKIGEKAILERAAEYLMGDTFDKIVKELEKKPISPPRFEHDEIVKGKPFKFTATYYVMPPDPQEIAEEIRKKQFNEHGGIPSPDEIFQNAPPNIQSTLAGYAVSPETLRSVPAIAAGLGEDQRMSPFFTGARCACHGQPCA